MSQRSKRLFVGYLALFTGFGVLLVMDPTLKLARTFHALPSSMAQAAGISITLCIMVASAGLGANLARQRGLSVRKWVVVCFFLNVWALIYLWSIPRKGK